MPILADWHLKYLWGFGDDCIAADNSPGYSRVLENAILHEGNELHLQGF